MRGYEFLLILCLVINNVMEILFCLKMMVIMASKLTDKFNTGNVQLDMLPYLFSIELTIAIVFHNLYIFRYKN